MFTLALVFILLVSSIASAGGITSSIGINSNVTKLDGTGVLIGMVEQGHPARDGIEISLVTVPHVNPAGVFVGTSNTQATPGQQLSPSTPTTGPNHATHVAEILNGSNASGGTFKGVAPGANLYAAAIQGGDTGGTQTLNAMAQRTIPTPLPFAGERVRAINMSYGRTIEFFIETLDGNSFLTQFVDWSASEHDVTYVTSWPNMGDGRQAPSDNFNGLTIAPSKFVGDDVIRTAIDTMEDPLSDADADGDRTSIDFLAPGEAIPLMEPVEDEAIALSGSSFAAPHVTGSVALLQQYAVQQIAANNPAFDLDDSRRHEVMKTVLINTADKLIGVHGSKRLVLDNSIKDWTQSNAAADPMIPLHIEFGSGHINVERALEQYKGGQSSPGMVEDVGWDFRKSGGIGDQFEYTLGDSVDAGDYIAVTLAWDRVVTPLFSGSTYDPSAGFANYGDIDDVLSDLNLYLMPVGETDLANAVAKSTSDGGSVEHIFFKGHGGGDFKIVVAHEGSFFSESDGSSASLDAQTEFAISWWSYEPSSILFGDYNHDGSIDQLDYDTWTASFGDSVFPGRDADGNLDGIINAADYTVWRDAFAAISLSVPEPSALVLLLASAGVLGTRKST